MNVEDFDNDLSSDDSDFCPDKHEQQQSASENSGIEDVAVDSDEARGSSKNTKRNKTLKHRKSKPAAEEIKVVEEKLDPEEEKRKADAIWAEFLSSTESPLEIKPVETLAPPTLSSATATSPKLTPSIPGPVEKEIFEFAGETVEVPLKPSQAEKSTSSSKSSAVGFKRSSGGGLSSVLNQLSKKNKLSVLEKTKLDWDGFKSNEGISEELQTHNRGRDG